MWVLVIFLQLIVFYCTSSTGQNVTNVTSTTSATTIANTTEKSGKSIVEKKTASKYDNPDFVRDRLKEEMYKPQYPAIKNRFKKPYSPSWQSYCDPSQCITYDRQACGLNRKSMRFKWFKSLCHLILNNQCANYRGFLKYDAIENKYCQVYVMYLRNGCTNCDEDTDEVPVCGVSRTTAHVVLFKNRCAMNKENCEKEFTDYQEVQMFLCEFYLHSLVK